MRDVLNTPTREPTMPAILRILGSVLRMERLAGARTYVAALGLFGLGLSQFADGNYDAAATSILAALALVGLHDKPTAAPTGG